MARIWIVGIMLFAAEAVAASTAGEVANLIAQKHAPAGVVFEIVDGDKNYLQWALPEIKKHATRLRQRFPDLDIAVVSHGKEQFALMKNKANEQKDLHKQVRSLVNNDKVTLHVCGTHASWYDVAPEEFADFVDVAAAAPAQINDYRALGFVVIRVRK